MRFKFGFAVILSIILHVSLFALAIYLPRLQSSSGTIYYVDLVNLPGGGGSGGKGINNTKGELVDAASIRDLTVKKESQSKLRYPDKKSKKKSPREKKEDKLVTVVKNKDRNKFKKDDSKLITTKRKGIGSDALRTGISSGSGGGSGGGFGSGSGTGYGPGSGTGFFPYAYYIETLRGRISASWYSSLVSPGLKGKYVAVVYFRILRNGTIMDLKLEQKSGNDSLDLSALRAIRAASPFPQLPGDFVGQYLGVHFEFEWEK